MGMRLTLTDINTRHSTTALALLDSGCTRSSIDPTFVRINGLRTKPVEPPIPVRNGDGTINGYVKEYVEVEVGITDSDGTPHRELLELQVVKLSGLYNIFIGYDWLERHNPVIDWTQQRLVFARCPDTCNISDKEIEHIGTYLRRIEHLEDHGTYPRDSTKSTSSGPGQLPKEYKEFADLMAETDVQRLPDRGPWDHAIDLKPGAENNRNLKGKIYPLSKVEQEELDKFIDKNLKAGLIRPSKSPIASPFFFVPKKDGSRRPTQDYRRINAETIKNSWPLPLISDVLNKVETAKYFTKLDIQ